MHRCQLCYPLIFDWFLEEIGNFYYGNGQQMKPHRIRVTHNLILNYGMYKKMEIYVSVVDVLSLCEFFV
jgi:hypothetical protein